MEVNGELSMHVFDNILSIHDLDAWSLDITN